MAGQAERPLTRSANASIAGRLREAADLLAAQQDNPFRIGAYRQAADSVAALDRDVGDILGEGGVEALDRIPHVGRGIAAAIAEMAATGQWSYLQRLRGAAEPQELFQAIPGVGPGLAKRLHEELGVETLEQLETALADSKTAPLKGFGRRRLAMIQSGLDHILTRIRPARGAQIEEPGVDVLLDVDREYREKSESGLLPRIAPKRHNPKAEAWLPVLHTIRGKWHFTALHSNTARAHDLGKVLDWVVVYFHEDDRAGAQRTVVTETRGPLLGKRVVRGREEECMTFHETAKAG
ncbi:MAG: helix-hairpin-helix domain-containing protein [Beijerinckiaceae bacterium]|jgi:hypothetical protein